MQKNEQKASVTPDNDGDGRAPSTPDPTPKNWAAPVSDELKAPNSQPARDSAPAVGADSRAQDSTAEPDVKSPDPKVEDPVTDRNGRAPNPPATPST
jgi:hypothetical protein